MLITSITVTPYRLEDFWSIFRTNYTGPQGIPFKQGDVSDMPIFYIRVWWFPWLFRKVAFSANNAQMRWPDGSLKMGAFVFRVPPMMWPRRKIYIYSA